MLKIDVDDDGGTLQSAFHTAASRLRPVRPQRLMSHFRLRSPRFVVATVGICLGTTEVNLT